MFLLPVYLHQLEKLHGQPFKGMGREEISCLVTGFKNFPFLSLDHGRELVEVSDKNHLLAPERKPSLDTIEPQKLVHAVQEVCPDHGDFVYDYGVGRLVDIFFLALCDFFHFIQSHIGLEFEEGVNGLTPDIQGGNPGGSEDNHLLFGILAEVFQKRGFSCAGLSGDENVFRGVLKEVKRSLEFLVDLDFRVRGMAFLNPCNGLFTGG